METNNALNNTAPVARFSTKQASRCFQMSEVSSDLLLTFSPHIICIPSIVACLELAHLHRTHLSSISVSAVRDR